MDKDLSLFRISENAPPDVGWEEVWVIAPTPEKAFAKAIAVIRGTAHPPAVSLTIERIVDFKSCHEA